VTQLGFLLITVGVVLVALEVGGNVVDTHWLGGALIGLGAAAIVWGNVEKHL
jgi:uncharacterized membrane protein